MTKKSENTDNQSGKKIEAEEELESRELQEEVPDEETGE